MTPTVEEQSPASASPARSAKVLVVEDRKRQRQALTTALDARGFDVVEAANGIDALELALHAHPDVVLLDLGLPDLDGLDVCRRLLALAPVPIIIVSAEGDEARTLQAFELGAVDYVRKPYSTPVLVARIGVALRGHIERIPDAGSHLLRSGDVEVDLLARQARVEPTVLDLTGRQLDLLVLLMRNEDRLLSAARVQAHLWGADAPDRASSLRNAVSAVRKALTAAGSHCRVETEAGLGYRWSVGRSPSA